MPETNDYLSQLMARVNERLNESETSGSQSGTGRASDDGPVKPHVFTTGGRFDDVPAAEEENKETPAEESKPTAAPQPEPKVTEPEEEEEPYDQEDDPEDYEEDLPQDTQKTDEATFSFSPDGEDYSRKDVDGPRDSEDILDWNVSEDVEKYLTSERNGSIFSDIPKEKKTARARRQEKRRLKANTRQLMDSNSGKRRGCFSAVFHLILILILVSLTILAVLYMLQTIADVTILDVDKIIAYITQKVSALIQYLAQKFTK